MLEIQKYWNVALRFTFIVILMPNCLKIDVKAGV